MIILKESTLCLMPRGDQSASRLLRLREWHRLDVIRPDVSQVGLEMRWSDLSNEPWESRGDPADLSNERSGGS